MIEIVDRVREEAEKYGLSENLMRFLMTGEIEPELLARGQPQQNVEVDKTTRLVQLSPFETLHEMLSASGVGAPVWNNVSTTAKWATDGLIGTHEKGDLTLFRAEEALQYGGLNWEVQKEPLRTSHGVQMEGKFLTVRKDNGLPLGIVGRAYTTLQNREAFDFFDTVCEDPNGPKYIAAGSLGQGQRVWLLAKLPWDVEIVPGDVTYDFLVLSNSHDGLYKMEIFQTPVRLMCANVLSVPMSRRLGTRGWRAFSWKHIGDVRNARERAQNVLQIARSNSNYLREMSERMLSFRPSEEETSEILEGVLAPYIAGKVTTQSENIWNRVLELTKHGRGNTTDEVSGTGWALYNGLTEYINHARPIHSRVVPRDEARLEQVWFGANHEIMSRAADFILTVAERHEEKKTVSVPKGRKEK